MPGELYAFECGFMTMPARIFVQGERGKFRFPAPAYLIRHPKGLALFDTGLSPAMAGDQQAYLGPLAAYTGVEFTAGETIAQRLAAAGFDIGQVDLVINSHLHFDHAGGNCACRNADVIAQRAEAEFAATEEAGEGYKAADWRTGQHLRLIEGEFDVFGDGAVVCIPTPGHTAGHQSLRVRTDRGEAILCGDACYLRRTLEQTLLPGVLHDEAAYRGSLARIAKFAASGAHIFYGHDPEFWASVPQGPTRVL